LAKFAQPIKPGEDRQEPTKEMIEAKFWEVYPRCWAKILQEVKVGMIVVFHDLGDIRREGIRNWSIPGCLSGKDLWQEEDKSQLL